MIKEYQTAILWQGLEILKGYLGSDVNDLDSYDRRVELSLPPWWESIVKKITGCNNLQDKHCIKKEPINSIFAEVSLPPGKGAESVFIEPRPLSIKSLPFEDFSTHWKEDAAKQINGSLERVRNNPVAILALLEKYASFIRVGYGEEYESVSLFELTRYMASLAVPVEKLSDINKPYLLVSGDLSGIQNFIYTISSTGALKSLRGRSFFLELLVRHIIIEILGKELTEACVFLQNGGGFTLLIPHNEMFVKRLGEVRQKTNRWLLDHFQSRLYFGLTWLPISAEETLSPHFTKVWKRAGQQLERDKQTKHKEDLDIMFQVREPVQKGKEEECQICHRDDIPAGEVSQIKDDTLQVCSFCKAMYELGEKLTDFKYVLRKDGNSPLSVNDIEMPGLTGPSYYSIVKGKGSPGRYLAKNTLELDIYLDGRTQPFFFADYVTSEKDINPANSSEITANLQDLADKSVGKAMLGSLRMDLDHLTITFSSGFGDKCGDLLRYATLSRQIGYFFTVYLNLICNGKDKDAIDVMNLSEPERGRYVSIIYAGGDDLFITGAWSEVVELAVDIAMGFKKYVHGNSDLTISGGVFMSKPDFPLYQIARLSGEAEAKAKKRSPPCGRRDCSPRYESCPLLITEDLELYCLRHNCGILFYNPERDFHLKYPEGENSGDRKDYTMSWEEIRSKVIPLVQMLTALQNKENKTHLEFEHLSRGFIRRLFGIVETWEQKGILYLPLMHYMVRRMRDGLSAKLKDKSSDEELKKHIEDLLGGTDTGKGLLLKQEMISYLWTCLTWIDFLAREE